LSSAVTIVVNVTLPKSVMCLVPLLWIVHMAV